MGHQICSAASGRGFDPAAVAKGWAGGAILLIAGGINGDCVKMWKVKNHNILA